MNKLLELIKSCFNYLVNISVNVKARYILYAIVISVIIGGFTFMAIKRASEPESVKIEREIQKEYKVTRHFNDTAWGTYWNGCGGWFTAAHVHEEMSNTRPPFAKGSTFGAPRIIDIVWYGRKFKCDSFPEIKLYENVYILGFPAGSDKTSLRTGKVYLKRQDSSGSKYLEPTWIVVFDANNSEVISDPVVGGMSGSVVVNSDHEAIGVLVEQNSPTDLDSDGDLEQSGNVVALSDFYRIVMQGK